MKDTMPTHEPDHDAQIFPFPTAAPVEHGSPVELEPQRNIARRVLSKVVDALEDKFIQKESWGGDVDHYGAHSRHQKLDK